MTTGGRVINALQPTTPDVGAVSRSMLGVLAVVAVAVASGSASAAVWAAGAAAIAGAIAMQDSPAGRVPLVIVVSLQMGAVVFIGALIASYNAVFIAVVAVWCFAAGMQWAVRSKAGMVATATAALLVISPPVAPSMAAVVLSTVLTVAAGCVQAALIAVWPPQRWRGQRDALTRAYRELAADARRVAADREASVDVAPLTWLREAFVDSDATQRPLAYHGGYRLPERITATLESLRGSDDGVSQLLSPAAGFLDAIADERQGLLPRTQPLRADFRRDVNEQGQIRLRFTDGNVNHRLHFLQIQLAAVALIRRGGIVETVAHDDLSGGEGGADDFADELGAAGVHQQQLSLGGHRVVLKTVLECVADLLANGRAARFAMRAHAIAERGEPFDEQPHLRGLAAAFRAFEADEEAFHFITGKTFNAQHSTSKIEAFAVGHWVLNVER